MLFLDVFRFFDFSIFLSNILVLLVMFGISEMVIKYQDLTHEAPYNYLAMSGILVDLNILVVSNQKTRVVFEARGSGEVVGGGGGGGGWRL